MKYTEVNSIHNTLTKANNQDSSESEGSVSLDSDLDVLIVNLKQKAQSLDQDCEMFSLTSTIMKHHRCITLGVQCSLDATNDSDSGRMTLLYKSVYIFGLE